MPLAETVAAAAPSKGTLRHTHFHYALIAMAPHVFECFIIAALNFLTQVTNYRTSLCYGTSVHALLLYAKAH